jgi:phosphoserine phosphatase
MIVFDFDKTLINKDSLFGFYKQVHGQTLLFDIKSYFLILCAFFYKIKLINNTQLKHIGVNLFLKGRSLKEIVQHADEYAKKLKLNEIHEQYFVNHQNNNEKCLIVSAGLYEYISRLYSSELVLASKLAYRDGIVCGLESNLYGKKKEVVLKKLGYNEIDILYTDSFVDKPLMAIAKKVYVVERGKIIYQFTK